MAPSISNPFTFPKPFPYLALFGPLVIVPIFILPVIKIAHRPYYPEPPPPVCPIYNERHHECLLDCIKVVEHYEIAENASSYCGLLTRERTGEPMYYCDCSENPVPSYYGCDAVIEGQREQCKNYCETETKEYNLGNKLMDGCGAKYGIESCNCPYRPFDRYGTRVRTTVRHQHATQTTTVERVRYTSRGSHQL